MRKEDQQESLALNTETLHALEASQKELLDAVDELRYIGVGKFVNLPQIIVVGDQNAGKSSVLEAISRVRFPIKGSLCTRFATELVMRKTLSPQVEVSIKPAHDDSAEMKSKLESFRKTDFDSEDLESLIAEAKRHMNMLDNGSFSRRTLVVKISGPDIPSLTLVDLPGFYSTEGKTQSKEDSILVRKLAASYMEQPSSIMLAVISARTSLVNQPVLNEAGNYDRDCRRTIGIITKPDSVTLADQAEYVEYAKNSGTTHRLLSWHILRNRSETEMDHSDKQRDECEKKLLGDEPWSEIPDEDRGIANLRTKLSRVLLNHIEKSLPSVISRIEERMANRQAKRLSMGDARDNPRERQRYLQGIRSQFESLVTQAFQGVYQDNTFFEVSNGAPNSELYKMRKLRKWVTDINKTFVAVMAEKGAARTILWHNRYDRVSDLLPVVPPELQDMASLYEIEEPAVISQDELLREMIHRSWDYDGRNFPNSSSSPLALKLFEMESRKWESIALQHINIVLNAALAFVQEAFAHIISEDEDTRDRIWTICVLPFFQKKRDALTAKVKEFLPKCSRTGFAQAHVTEFNSRIAVRHKRRLDSRGRSLLERHPDTPAFGNRDIVRVAVELEEMEHKKITAVETDIDHAVECYGMSLRTFTENVVILAVENALMGDIMGVFEDVLDFDDDKLAKLASESKRITDRRQNLDSEIATLKKGLETCEKFRRPGFVNRIPERSLLTEAAVNSVGVAKPGLARAPTEEL